MKTKSTCFTYFYIVGKFKTKEIEKLLGIKPFKKCDIGDRKTKSTCHESASFSCCLCDEYDVMVHKQMEKTIQPLKSKIEVLNKIKKDYNASFYLEVVPEIYTGGVTPCISPSIEVINFCYATRTELDIDYYIMTPPCPHCGKQIHEED